MATWISKLKNEKLLEYPPFGLSEDQYAHPYLSRIYLLFSRKYHANNNNSQIKIKLYTAI